MARQPPEPISNPDQPIIDTHHHLWDRPDFRYLLHDFLADTNTGHNIVATVFLQCHTMYRAHGPEELRPVGETEFVAGIAAMSDSGGYGKTRIAAGIVGYADLTLGDRVEAVLEAQIRAGGGRFRGVRHSGNWDPDPIIGNGAPGPDVYQRADFRAGLARLSALGLSLDAWVFHTQLADVIDLARAFPTTNIIMGHVGGVLGYGPYAGKHDEIYTSWKKSITELCKVPERDDETRRHDDAIRRVRLRRRRTARYHREELATLWRPYIETCIDLFGANRCMFESNFPVEKMGIGYAALWNAFKRIASSASASEKQALFSGTARRAYRLE